MTVHHHSDDDISSVHQNLIATIRQQIGKMHLDGSQKVLAAAGVVSLLIPAIPGIIAVANGHNPDLFIKEVYSFCATLSPAQAATEISTTLNSISHGQLALTIGAEGLKTLGTEISNTLRFLHENHLALSLAGSGLALIGSFGTDYICNRLIANLRADKSIQPEKLEKMIGGIEKFRSWIRKSANITGAAAIATGAAHGMDDAIGAAQYAGGDPIGAAHTLGWFGHTAFDMITPPLDAIGALLTVLLQHSHHIISAVAGFAPAVAEFTKQARLGKEAGVDGMEIGK